jgi:ethanolamine utilization protein EutA
MSHEAGGRIFFSSIGRSLEEEDEIRLVSVGIDIGLPPGGHRSPR